MPCPSSQAGPLGPGMEVNEAPVEPQSHALPEPAGENKSFPCNHRKTVPNEAVFWFECLNFILRRSPGG